MRKKLSLQNQILLVLAAGFVAGTFFANFPGKEYIGELGIFSDSYRKYLAAGEQDVWSVFIYMLIQRLVPAAVLMAFIYSRWRTQILCLMAFWCTFSLGIYWSSCILVCGMKGMILFFLSLLPHGLLYGLGWMRLGRAAMERVTGINWLPETILFLGLGAAAEAWLHPGILKVLFQVFL